jgi:hypothetical protein
LSPSINAFVNRQSSDLELAVKPHDLETQRSAPRRHCG